MAENRKPYKTDVTDEMWALLEPLVHIEQTDGRPREVSLREVVNTLLYIEKTGVQWDMLPHDLPPKSTVWGYHKRWAQDGTWERVLVELNKRVRKKKSAKRRRA